LADSSAGSCLVYYERFTNRLLLLNDAGTVWQPATLGNAATLENGQCSIAVGNSAALLAGDLLTLQLAITFKPVFAGPKNIYMYTQATSGVSGWLDRGDWNVPGPVSPVTADAAVPNAGNTASQTFALTYSSTSGAGSLTAAWVWFNPTFAQTAAASCLAYYESASGLVYVLNDTGTAWQSAPIGSATTLQNSQCAISLAGSQAVPSGNTLTLTLDVTFKPAFAEDERGARAGEDFLEHFQLLEPREVRVFREQLGRVGLAARGGRLLTPLDQVGLGFLLGGDDLVEQGLHVAGQDDVAQADALDRHADGFGAGGEGGSHFGADRLLVGEEGVEGPRADRGAQHELRFAVEGLGVIRGRGDGFQHVGHEVGAVPDLVQSGAGPK